MAGRPYKFNDPAELQALVDQYFKEREEKNIPPTIGGLCLAIGVNRSTLLEYEATTKEERLPFVDIIEEAKLRIDDFAEQQLFLKGGSGPIFYLKNRGWKDKTEVYQEVSYTQMGRVFTEKEIETDPEGGKKSKGVKKIVQEIHFDIGEPV